jgi:eukaryotic-like serine/threonine-protein kinase
MSDTNAAESLEGLTLDSGWKVVAKVEKPLGATGGYFSACYIVEKETERCFLKAFNFSRFLQLATDGGVKRQIVDVVSEMLDAYKYERDLSALCSSKHVTKVAFVREAGEQLVQGFSITVVPYLIFNVADGGDIRGKLRFSSTLESSWKLKSLHSVAVGLKQLHGIDVSHQDLKPSNVLIFGEESKIGDLGRSTTLAIASPLREQPFAGDWSYAPPELLYGVHEPDWRKRSFATDSYLLGSLIVFYFSGLTMTALLRQHLPDDASWERHRGSYDDVMAYVLQAFTKALDEFKPCVGGDMLRRELRALVEQLCNPVPSKRIFSGRVGAERVVTRLDVLHRRVLHSVTSNPNDGK